MTLSLKPGQSILEAALASGIPYPHNCTVGTCGSCKTLLKQGRVKAASDFGYVLSKQELDAGYILACQAMPREEHTVVQIADVGADLPPPENFEARIVATEELTSDICKLVVQIDRPLNYVAGQYVNLSAPDFERPRHYSLADSPQRGGRERLSFIIRRVADGAFTGALFGGLLADRPLHLQAPHGDFHLRPGNAPMLCVVGGSGLGPVFSVLEDMRNRRVRRHCVLLFGARTQADLYYLDQIAQLARGWIDRFDFMPVLSAEPADSNWCGARGLVTDFIAPAAGSAWPDHEGYLCGPPPMVDAGIAALTGLGVPLHAIYFDRFTDGSI